MEIGRRSLMKGMLAGGALLALGTPPWAFADQPSRRPRHCLLLLGDTRPDHMFESGARGACAGMAYKDMETVKLKGGLLAGTDRMIKLLEQSRGARWIAVMDDAGAAIFLELARTAGARLISMGMHACSMDHSSHDLATASAACSPGGRLATQLSRGPHGFSIKETFLHALPAQAASTGWSAKGFLSYRLNGAEALHMHCSGLSLSEGCELMSLRTTDHWIPIPPQAGHHDSVTWQTENGVESVGYAAMATALGADSAPECCAGRAFVHQSSRGTGAQPTERFASFIMDV
ncbi:hypothetical protein [Nitrospira sp. Nam74]